MITRITVSDLSSLMEEDSLSNNSVYFYEYISSQQPQQPPQTQHNLLQLRGLFNDKRCQTVSYIGNKDMFTGLLESCEVKGIKGVKHGNQFSEFLNIHKCR